MNGRSLRIGVDLGGTKIEVIALDENNRELIRRRTATPAGNYAGTIAAIVALVGGVEAELGVKGSVGIGTPGATSRTTGLIKNANSTVLIGKNFAADVTQALGREVRIANDANCLVLSESIDGAAAGVEVAFAAILGTGVGGGIAVRQHILEGRNRVAGEWGHNPLPWTSDGELPGPACYCGKHGCIETWLCGPRFSAQFEVLSKRRLMPSQIADEARSGNTIAQEALDAYCDRLARSLAVIINVVDPDAIVLGGGVSNIPELYGALPRLLPRYVLAGEYDTPVVAAKHGDSSGVRGAAMLW